MRDEREDDRRAPVGDGSDSAEGAEARDLFSQSPAGVLLEDFLEAASMIGDDAQARYEEAVDSLHTRAGEVAVEIARAFGCSDDRDYSSRWMLVHAAAELRDERTLPLLANVTLTPIPPERTRAQHGFSTVAEETIIRATAVDAVSALAAEGNEQAADLLFQFLDLPSFSIRRAAVQGLLKSPRGAGFRDRIEESLPSDQRFLLDLKPTSVEEMQQIRRPQALLSERGRQSETPPPPSVEERVEPEDRNGPEAEQGEGKRSQ